MALETRADFSSTIEPAMRVGLPSITGLSTGAWLLCDACPAIGLEGLVSPERSSGPTLKVQCMPVLPEDTLGLLERHVVVMKYLVNLALVLLPLP